MASLDITKVIPNTSMDDSSVNAGFINIEDFFNGGTLFADINLSRTIKGLTLTDGVASLNQGVLSSLVSVGIGIEEPLHSLSILRNEASVHVKSTGQTENATLTLDSGATGDSVIKLDDDNTSIWAFGMDNLNNNAFTWAKSGSLSIDSKMVLTTSGDLSLGNIGTTGRGLEFRVIGNEGITKKGDVGGWTFGIAGARGSTGNFLGGLGASGVGDTLSLWYIGTDSDRRVVFTTSGSVGIGTTNPVEKLDVAGAISMTDGINTPDTHTGKVSLYIDSADGDFKIRFGDGTIKTIVTDT